MREEEEDEEDEISPREMPISEISSETKSTDIEIFKEPKIWPEEAYSFRWKKRKSGPEEESETEKREKRSRFETLDGDIGGGGGGEKWWKCFWERGGGGGGGGSSVEREKFTRKKKEIEGFTEGSKRTKETREK